jgi:hypothetical protein
MYGNETALPRLASLPTACLATTALLGALLLLPAETSAQDEEPPQSKLDFHLAAPRMSLGLRGGWAFNRADGEIYDDLTELLTLEKGDFDAPAVAGDVSWRLTSWLDAMLGFEVSSRKVSSEFRHFIEDNGNPITQDTRLSQVPLTVSLKFYPIGRGRQVGSYAWVRHRVVPYVGGGIGGTWYRLEQHGDFLLIDPPGSRNQECPADNPCIVEGDLASEGWAFAQHVFVGADFKLTRSLGLVLEGRYYWASAPVGGDFLFYDSISLDGARLMIGINWKL